MNKDTTVNPLEVGNDENERLALEECVKRQRVDRQVSVLVLPAGHCEVAIKFARLGAHVTAADDVALQGEVQGRALAAGFADNIGFAPCSLASLPEEMPGAPYDIIFVRRGLCNMPYEDARAAVRRLLLKLKIGGKLYVSTLGLHSELGEGYADHVQPIDQRFAKLSASLAKKYNINYPVCLYTERNLFMLLLEAGASVLRTLTTTHGNVKGIGVRV